MPRHKQNPGQSEKKAANTPQALLLRTQGMSYRAIGAEMGISVATAYKYVSGELAKLAKECHEQATELRDIEDQRLHDAITRISKSEAYQAGDPQAVNTMIRLSESRRKLFGLDAPAKTDITSGGEAVKGFNVILPSEGNHDDTGA